MSQTESTYLNHPIHTTLENLSQHLQNPAFSDPSVSSSEVYSFARDKVSATVEMIKSHLASTPATLISIPGLSQLQNNLQPVVAELNAFISNKNPGHLSNATASIDSSVLPLIWSFPSRISDNAIINSVASLIENLRVSSLNTIQALNKEKDALEARASTLSASLTVERTKLDSLSETIAQQKADALAVTAQVQQEFAKNETERAALAAAAISDFKNAQETHANETKTGVDTLVSYIERRRDEVTLLVEAIGNTGLTGNYQRIANKEAKEANFWRWVTVALFGVGIAVAVFTFKKFLQEPFTPESAWAALVRLLYAVAITCPAWYTAKESARHRTNADSAKQTELELAALGPFIELMPTEKKQAIREELVKKYFGKESTPHQAEPPIKVSDLKDILIETIKTVKK